MPKRGWIIQCPACGDVEESYEEYLRHIYERHPDKPSLRVRMIIKRQE